GDPVPRPGTVGRTRRDAQPGPVRCPAAGQEHHHPRGGRPGAQGLCRAQPRPGGPPRRAPARHHRRTPSGPAHQRRPGGPAACAAGRPAGRGQARHHRNPRPPGGAGRTPVPRRRRLRSRRLRAIGGPPSRLRLIRLAKFVVTTTKKETLMNASLPVVVIGAGPVGLAAAAHLLERGLEPLVLEAGERVGAGMLSWAHVRMFSPWRYNVDRAASALLERHGWRLEDPEGFPTGADMAERYLAPLAATPELAPRIRTGSRVIAVSRWRRDRMKDAGRADTPFLVRYV